LNTTRTVTFSGGLGYVLQQLVEALQLQALVVLSQREHASSRIAPGATLALFLAQAFDSIHTHAWVVQKAAAPFASQLQSVALAPWMETSVD
jgi:hypothetical protein